MTADDRTPGPAYLEAAYRVRFDEATASGHLRGSALLGYLQDVAWRHSVAHHFARSWYAERGLAWLVRSIDLVLLAPASDGDDVTVDTRVGGWRRVLARRISVVRAADGTAIARALVDWAMTDGRTVVRIPDDFAVFPSVHAAPFAPTRVPLPETPVGAAVIEVRVRRREVDPMGHANNGVYIDWFDEAVAAAGGDVATTAFPRRYRLEYLRPAAPGALLAAEAWPDGDGWAHRLRDPNGDELLRGRLDPVDPDEAAAVAALAAPRDPAAGDPPRRDPAAAGDEATPGEPAASQGPGPA